jgi:hypothetical protein
LVGGTLEAGIIFFAGTGAPPAGAVVAAMGSGVVFWEVVTGIAGRTVGGETSAVVWRKQLGCEMSKLSSTLPIFFHHCSLSGCIFLPSWYSSATCHTKRNGVILARRCGSSVVQLRIIRKSYGYLVSRLELKNILQDLPSFSVASKRLLEVFHLWQRP